MRIRLALAGLIAAVPVARADRADLQLRDLPVAPPRLQMRPPAAPRAAAAPALVIPPRRGRRPARRIAALPSAAAPATTTPSTATVAAGSMAAARPGTSPAATARVRDTVFRLDLGYAVDGAGVSRAAATFGEGRLAAVDGLPATVDYAAVRGYGFGDLYLGGRGRGRPWLNTYLASRARFSPSSSAVAPLPTVYDGASDLQIRAAWAETDEIFRSRWMAPVRFRAGRQYVYGTAIAHMDGLTAAWEGRGIDVHGYVGRRVPDYYETVDGSSGSTASYLGMDVRLDLGALWKVPLVLTGSLLEHADYRHSEITAAYTRPSKDLVIRASARAVNGDWARETAIARIQLSDVTQITVDLQHRGRADWRWDANWVRDSEESATLRLLDLGPVAPRVQGSLRAGTVLLDNVDLLLRAGTAVDLSDTSDQPSYFTPGWIEIGAALEVRARRALALGVSGVARSYDRPDDQDEIFDAEADFGAERICEMEGRGSPLCLAQPLPPRAVDLGEVSYFQGGFLLRYSAGARRFSATGELYARSTVFTKVYLDNDPEAEERAPNGDRSRDNRDQRGGGRFTIEAWPTPRVRILAEYELTTQIEVAPEIRGYKSLRLLAEASF